MKLCPFKDLVVKNERKKKKKLKHITAHESLLAHLKPNNNMFIDGHYNPHHQNG
jgi:hypothetical protein